MPSTYTTRNGIELIATGEQSGEWGATTNLNFQIVDRALSGVGTIDLSGSGAAHTLTTTDGTLTDGMYKLLVLDGATEACTITVSPNDAQKIYFVYNNSGNLARFRRVQAVMLQSQMATLSLFTAMARVQVRLSRTSLPIWPCLPSIYLAELSQESQTWLSQMEGLVRQLHQPH